MEVVSKKVTEFVKKYRYVILVLVIGIGLMLLPGGKTQTKVEVTRTAQPDLAQQLQQVLSHVKGAGDVEVLLTVSAGEQTVFQTDGDSRDTVTVTDSDRNEQGLVQQVLPPKYQGAVVLCEGAEDPAVRLAIVEAVADATGLGADRISVLKMK